jgi:hypothetical protein
LRSKRRQRPKGGKSPRHLRVAFCFIGGVGAKTKQRRGSARACVASVDNAQRAVNPPHLRVAFYFIGGVAAEMKLRRGSTGACVASVDNAQRAVNPPPPPGGLLLYWLCRGENEAT